MLCVFVVLVMLALEVYWFFFRRVFPDIYGGAVYTMFSVGGLASLCWHLEHGSNQRSLEVLCLWKRLVLITLFMVLMFLSARESRSIYSWPVGILSIVWLALPMISVVERLR